MEDWQQRVIDEHSALEQKLLKLDTWLEMNEDVLLEIQASIMVAYERVLAIRIATFE
jgi:hypothetical protein